MRRRASAALCGVILAATPFGPAQPGGGHPLGDVGSHEIIAAKPGTLLRVWPQVGGAVENAKAYRILYRSTGLKGEPIAGIEEMLDRGFVIAATDYAGLGGEGMHPYLIGDSEARSVLDSVRAARQLPDAAAGDRFAVWGHSEGGHAALFAGEAAAAYAPELKLVGVAAAAPATYLAELFRADRGSVAGNTLTAMALLSWSTIYDISLDNVVVPSAMRSFKSVATSCIERITELLTLQQVEAPLQRAFLEIDPTKVEPWSGIMQRNSPGQVPPGAPVLILQGTADDLVRPTVTEQFANHLCKGGHVVEMTWLEGVSHAYAGYEGADAAVRWMAERFAGRPAPNGCHR